MSRYRQTIEFVRRPFGAVAFLLGVFLLAEAIWLRRDAAAFMAAVPLILGSIVSWLVPSGRRAHPASESTLQWARKQRRE